MKNFITGLMLGAVAGVIDVIPMIFMKLTWDANLSAFFMWVVIGFFLTVSNLEMKGWKKGLLTSYLVLLPSAFLIGWNDPAGLVPVFVMTTLLGIGLGISVDKFVKKHN